MANRIDLLLNNNDVFVSNNDMILGNSDNQHVIDTINACPGWWKENPSDGVAIQGFVKGKSIEQELSRKMKLQLLADGYSSSPIVSFDSNKQLIVDPNVSL